MKKEKFYKYFIIFIIAATVINLSSLITILYKTGDNDRGQKIKLKKEIVHRHRSPFSPGRLKARLNLSEEQLKLIRDFKHEYRKRAEEINRDMFNYHNESLLLVTRESFDSLYADEIVQKQCMLHIKIRRESLRYLTKVKSVLNEEQREGLIKLIKDISEERYSDKRKKEKHERRDRRERENQRRR